MTDATFTIHDATVSRDPRVMDRVAYLPLCVESSGRKSYYDAKSFDARVMAEIGKLQRGDVVTVEGELMSEVVRVDGAQMTDKRGKPVYATGLKIARVTTAGEKPRARKEEPPPDDDPDLIPF